MSVLETIGTSDKLAKAKVDFIFNINEKFFFL